MKYPKVTRALAFSLCVTSPMLASVALAEQWDDPEALTEHITQRAPSLAAAERRAEAATARAESAARMTPDLQVEVGISPLPVETRLGPNRAHLAAVQALPQFRARALREQAFEQSADAVLCERAAQRLELRVETSRRLVQITALHAIDRALEELTELAGDALDATIDEAAHEFARQSDILQAQYVVEEIEARRIAVQRELSEHVATLAVWADDEELLIDDSMVQRVSASFSDGGAQDMVAAEVGEHPAIRALEARAAASDTQADAVLAQRRVRAAFSAKWAIITGRTDVDIPDEGRDALTFGVRLTLPTANGAERREAASIELESEAQLLARDALLEQLVAQAESLSRRHRGLSEELRRIDEALLPTASDRVDALVDELAHGQTDYVTLLDAVEAQVRLIVRRWQLWEAAANSRVALEATTNGALNASPWTFRETCSRQGEEQ